MRKCIWCNKDESFTSFDKDAHTFPQSLGGRYVCKNVCDTCNKYFGDKERMFPAVEIALKEVLNISRYVLYLHSKEKFKKRYTSEYFDFNMNSYFIKHKMKYKLQSGFQEEFARRFRRGIYKVYLEERERQKNDALDSRFDFIRAFARYDLNDCPIYYLQPKIPVLAISTDENNDPQIRFSEHSEELDKKYRFYSYPFFGNHLVIPTHNSFREEYLKLYQKYLNENDALGNKLIEINNIRDIDFTFQFLNTQ